MAYNLASTSILLLSDKVCELVSRRSWGEASVWNFRILNAKTDYKRPGAYSYVKYN